MCGSELAAIARRFRGGMQIKISKGLYRGDEPSEQREGGHPEQPSGHLKSQVSPKCPAFGSFEIAGFFFAFRVGVSRRFSDVQPQTFQMERHGINGNDFVLVFSKYKTVSM